MAPTFTWTQKFFWAKWPILSKTLKVFWEGHSTLSRPLSQSQWKGDTPPLIPRSTAPRISCLWRSPPPRGVATGWTARGWTRPPHLFPERVSGIESLWSVLISFRFYPQTLPPRLGRGHPFPHPTILSTPLCLTWRRTCPLPVPSRRGCRRRRSVRIRTCRCRCSRRSHAPLAAVRSTAPRSARHVACTVSIWRRAGSGRAARTYVSPCTTLQWRCCFSGVTSSL